MKLSKAFTATGTGGVFTLQPGESLQYTVTGTFVGTWSLWYTPNKGATAVLVDTGTATKTATTVTNNLTVAEPADYYFTCDAYTSGTLTGLLTKTVAVRGRKTILPRAKVGATSGFVVAAAADTALTTIPASQTASTLVIPVDTLRIGDTIVGFQLEGSIVSAGNTVTFDAALHKQVIASGGVTDSTLESMTQVTATAATLLSALNTYTALTADEVMAENVSYYILVTCTTGSSCTGTLLGAVINYLPNNQV